MAAYLDHERPADAPADRVFVVLKGPIRGRPLTAAGLDQILASARERAGLAHATCHELRHTCMTRLREAASPSRRCRPRPATPPDARLPPPRRRLAGRRVPAGVEAIDAQALRLESGS